MKQIKKVLKPLQKFVGLFFILPIIFMTYLLGVLLHTLAWLFDVEKIADDIVDLLL